MFSVVQSDFFTLLDSIFLIFESYKIINLVRMTIVCFNDRINRTIKEYDHVMHLWDMVRTSWASDQALTSCSSTILLVTFLAPWIINLGRLPICHVPNPFSLAYIIYLTHLLFT